MQFQQNPQKVAYTGHDGSSGVLINAYIRSSSWETAWTKKV